MRPRAEEQPFRTVTVRASKARRGSSSRQCAEYAVTLGPESSNAPQRDSPQSSAVDLEHLRRAHGTQLILLQKAGCLQLVCVRACSFGFLLSSPHDRLKGGSVS